MSIKIIPSFDSEVLASQAIACDHGPVGCQCPDLVRQLALTIDTRIALARGKALESAARCIETQYRRESDALHQEDGQHETLAIIRRVRVRDAAAIRALRALELP